MQEQITLGDILHEHGGRYISKNQLPDGQRSVIHLLSACRTAALGCHFEKCDHCGYTGNACNSCRNRHCPVCQQKDMLEWQDKRMKELLPVGYYHLVFTLPHVLDGWVQVHPKAIYDLLFETVWATLSAFGADPKRLDGQLGMTAVLHTWGQTLVRHVHLHCLVPGGA